jgi:3-hydroxyacyl-CoA dehydrogenase
VERALFALVNEGARILEEGIAARAGDIDVIWIHGYGFPRATGGPMFWADGVGLARVAEVVESLHAEQGDLVRPSPMLLALAREGGRFSEEVEE